MEAVKDIKAMYSEVKEALGKSMEQYCDLILDNRDDLSECNQKIVRELVPILIQIFLDLMKSEISSDLNANLNDDNDEILDDDDDNGGIPDA